MPQPSLDLPVNIPWKLLAVSQDMMDTTFCDDTVPYDWRSSLAIFKYEPDAADLDSELCDVIITYLKVTCTITGYTPTSEEIRTGHVSFPDVPTDHLNEILGKYFACYGALLNVSVFPNPDAATLSDQFTLNFGPQLSDTLPNPLIAIARGVSESGDEAPQVSFRADRRPQNQTVNVDLESGERKPALNLQTKMTVALPGKCSRVEAQVVQGAAAITMTAFNRNASIGSQTAVQTQHQVLTLAVEGDGIDRVVFTSPGNEAYLVQLDYYLPIELSIDLPDYPHIVDFEPKTRDLYQAATEAGETLTASNSEVKTDKSFSHTHDSQTGLSVSGTVGWAADQAKGGLTGSLTGGMTHSWGDTDKDSFSTQVDASRERRETQSTTTSLSQMYNLMTGYHPGTNRATFIMLARPHVLQPTDHRTFVQGLRYIEGVQDFLLIVERSKAIDGLCIEASLETGHFPEDVSVEEPAPTYDEDYEDFYVGAWVAGNNNAPFDVTYTIVREGFVVDTRHDRTDPDGRPADPGHTGVIRLGNEETVYTHSHNNGPTTVSFVGNDMYGAASATTVRVQGAAIENDGEYIEYKQRYRVLTRSSAPAPTGGAQPHVNVGTLFTTSRQLCSCFTSPKTAPVAGSPTSLLNRRNSPPPIEIKSTTLKSSVVNEGTIRINSALLTRDAASQTRQPAMKELLRQIHATMLTNSQMPGRRPIGKVGFLESDYFKNKIKTELPNSHLDRTLYKVKGLNSAVRKHFERRVTVRQALDLNLFEFSQRTGLSLDDALDARRRLLRLSPEPPERETKRKALPQARKRAARNVKRPKKR